MRQLITHLGSGEIELVEVPRPRPGPGELLIANELSVVSAGTERMLVEFGQASVLGKARQHPERVRQAAHKVRAEGVAATLSAVAARLQTPLPLGYSAVGRVLAIGEGVRGFAIGERVATNSSHAEVALVRAALAAHVPPEVSPRDGAFTCISAIALNALREAEAEVGSVVAILGLGLIGQTTARVAAAAGCRVLGFDPDAARACAVSGGHATADALLAAVDLKTEGAGADAVLIATDASAETVALATQLSRARATIVLLGGGDATLDRRAFYARELRFVVAHAYGPGRDEEAWETGKVDYPRHRVRWTARRNFEAALDLMARGALRFDDLEQREVPFAQARGAYAELAAGRGPVATLFRYDARVDAPDELELPSGGRTRRAPTGRGVSLVGAGNYATRVLIPALVAANADLRAVVSRGGLHASLAARRHGFSRATADPRRVWEAPDTHAVFIATPHETHVELAVAALEAGKHVWLEKPLAIDRAGLAQIEAVARRSPGVFMVGFNRRFAPTAQTLRDAMAGQGPWSLVYVVNAGALPADHWLHDPTRGGGRLVGEACHFVDLMRFLVGAPITSGHAARCGDSAALTFTFGDGSVGTVHYLTGGHPSVPKERLEVYGAGRIWQLDDFRTLRCADGALHPLQSVRRVAPTAQDKGHRNAVRAFLDAAEQGGPAPIPWEESVEVTRAIFDALDQ